MDDALPGAHAVQAEEPVPFHAELPDQRRVHHTCILQLQQICLSKTRARAEPRVFRSQQAMLLMGGEGPENAVH